MTHVAIKMWEHPCIKGGSFQKYYFIFSTKLCEHKNAKPAIAAATASERRNRVYLVVNTKKIPSIM